jgi:hypothetical protein
MIRAATLSMPCAHHQTMRMRAIPGQSTLNRPSPPGAAIVYRPRRSSFWRTIVRATVFPAAFRSRPFAAARVAHHFADAAAKAHTNPSLP